MLERLQKIISRAGIASRRHAEDLIRSGQVRVNDAIVTELGAKADPEKDRVEVAGRLAERPAEVKYFALNKPPHVVSTMSDPEGRATLRHLLRGLAGGIFPVGRLDYAASGLVLLTSDGELANRMFKTSARMSQVYWLKLKGRMNEELLRNLRVKARARLRRLRSPGSSGPEGENPWYEAELTDARSDALREMLFSAGHPVEKMRRVKVGPVEIGPLPEGHYRELAPGEVAGLRRAIERAEKAPKPPTKNSRASYLRRRARQAARSQREKAQPAAPARKRD